MHSGNPYDSTEKERTGDDSRSAGVKNLVRLALAMKLIDQSVSELALENLERDPGFDVRKFLEQECDLQPAAWIELGRCLQDFAERGEADTEKIERSIGEATEFVAFYAENFVPGSSTDPFKRPDADDDHAETVADETFRYRQSDETEVQGVSGKADQSRKISNIYDRYHIFSKIGGGGQSEVMGAWDVEVKRVVAIKSPKLDEFRNQSESGQQDICRRFVQEAYVTGQLKHPSIIPIFAMDYWPVDAQVFPRLASGIPFLVLPYYPNGVLKTIIANFHSETDSAVDSSRDRELKFRAMIGAVVQVCKAVAHAHDRGFIHRDIKPDNVLTGQHGEVYLSDWGLARPVRPEPGQNHPTQNDSSILNDDSHDQEGAVYGTIPYMSPEQANGHVGLHNKSTDIFLLGATLYAIAYSIPPYRTTSRDESLRKAMNCEVDFAGSASRFADSSLVAICRKAMNREQTERYPSAMALAADLERWLADQPLVFAAENRRRKTARFMKRHSRALAAASVVLMAGTTGLVIHNFRLAAVNHEVVQARDVAIANALAEQIAKQNETRLRNLAETNLKLAIDGITETLALIVSELPKIPGVEAVRLKICDSISKTAAKLARINREWLDLPIIEARTHREAGNIHRLTGNYEESKKRYEQGLSVLEELLQRFPDNEYVALIAPIRMCENLWDYAALSKLYGHYDEAGRLMSEAEGHMRSILKKPVDNTLKTQVALTHNIYFGELHAETGRDDELAKVIAQTDALLKFEPAMPMGLESISANRRILVLNLRAGHHYRAKRFDRAIGDHETILAILEDDFQKNNAGKPKTPENAKMDPDMRMLRTSANSNLAISLGEKDDSQSIARAAKLFENAWTEFGKLIEESPDTAVYLDDRLYCFVEMRAFERRRKYRFESLVKAAEEKKFDFEAAVREVNLLIAKSSSPDLLDLRARILSEKAHRESDPQKRAELVGKALADHDAAIKKLPHRVDFVEHREELLRTDLE